MTTKQPTDSGLRERKKEATRSALSEAALRLAMKRGLDQVRIEDIAAEAGVSPRTFNNYFSNKEEAIAANGTERADQLLAALRARPANEPLWKALGYAVAALFPDEPDRAWMARALLLKSAPTLMAAELKSDLLVERALAEGIADRTGTDAERDLYPRLVAATVVAAVHAALDHWLAAPASTTLRSTLSRALKQLSAGLPPPRRR